ncbi:MAG: hypothetical protein KBF93_17835 [Leptospiraceae bacterium]|nr:hypothetical protein [Leptospiraceae bacterium]
MSSENDIQKEQNELITMALESVSSDDDANLLLEGKLVDALLIKASVQVENRNGVMIFLFSLAKGDLLQVYSAFGNSPLLNRIRTFENVSQFLLDLIDAIKAGGIERALSDRIGRVMYKGLDRQTILSEFPKIEKKDYSNICEIIQLVINTELKIKTAKIQLDVEKISSLKFRVNNPLASVYTPISNPYTEAKKSAPIVVAPENNVSQEKAKAENLINDVQKNYKKVLMCKTVVAPVAGIDFENLKENMKLLFVLPFQTKEEIAIAKSVGAVAKDGTNKPITGEFLKIVTGGKNEYHIFAKGPNGTLLRAFEERPVKLAVSKKTSQTSKKDEHSELGKMMSIIVGILLVLVIILFFMYLA